MICTIKRLLNKIKLFFWSVKKSSSNISSMNSVFLGHPVDIVHEDSRAKESIKGTIASFESQKQAMKSLALKPHASDCDIINCKKRNCFIPAPDKIIMKDIEIQQSNRDKLNNMAAARIRKSLNEKKNNLDISDR